MTVKQLHPNTRALVARIARALGERIAEIQAERGSLCDWAEDDWEDACRDQLTDHLKRGDALSVAAYATFAWERGWATVETPQIYRAADHLLDCITATATAIRDCQGAGSTLSPEVIARDMMWLSNSLVILTHASASMKSDTPPDRIRAVSLFAKQQLERLLTGGGDPNNSAPETFARWESARTRRAVEILERVCAMPKGRRPLHTAKAGAGRGAAILQLVRSGAAKVAR